MARRKPLPAELPVQISGIDTAMLGSAQVDTGTVVREVRLRNALPGEQVVARILKRRKGMWYGNAALDGPADAQRRSAPCAVFPRCGGCAVQHVASEHQLEFKHDQLMSALRGLDVTAERVHKPVAGPQFGYRRKARLGVRLVGEQVFVGFREAYASRVVDMQACPVLDPRLSAMIEPLRTHISRLSVPGSIPQIEVAAGDDRVAVVVRHLEALEVSDIDVLTELADCTGADLYTQAGGYETIKPLPGRSAHLLGYALSEFGLHLDFAPHEFTQVNVAINQALVRQAVQALRGAASVADLFCGIGNFSLALARTGVQVLGMEASEDSVARAEMNARSNGLVGRVQFQTGDLYGDGAAALPLDDVDALLLDPPRSGAGPHLAAWLRPEISRVVYVSCNPATFASDARVLQDAGFSLAEVGIFDMFPQTLHVETLGVFVRA